MRSTGLAVAVAIALMGVQGCGEDQVVQVAVRDASIHRKPDAGSEVMGLPGLAVQLKVHTARFWEDAAWLKVIEGGAAAGGYIRTTHVAPFPATGLRHFVQPREYQVNLGAGFKVLEIGHAIEAADGPWVPDGKLAWVKDGRLQGFVDTSAFATTPPSVAVMRGLLLDKIHARDWEGAATFARQVLVPHPDEEMALAFLADYAVHTQAPDAAEWLARRPPPDFPAVPPVVAVKSGGRGYTRSPDIVLRRDPASDAGPLRWLPMGTEVKVVRLSDGWARVKVEPRDALKALGNHRFWQLRGKPFPSTGKVFRPVIQSGRLYDPRMLAPLVPSEAQRPVEGWVRVDGLDGVDVTDAQRITRAQALARKGKHAEALALMVPLLKRDGLEAGKHEVFSIIQAAALQTRIFWPLLAADELRSYPAGSFSPPLRATPIIRCVGDIRRATVLDHARPPACASSIIEVRLPGVDECLAGADTRAPCEPDLSGINKELCSANDHADDCREFVEGRQARARKLLVAHREKHREKMEKIDAMDVGPFVRLRPFADGWAVDGPLFVYRARVREPGLETPRLEVDARSVESVELRLPPLVSPPLADVWLQVEDLQGWEHGVMMAPSAASVVSAVAATANQPLGAAGALQGPVAIRDRQCIPVALGARGGGDEFMVPTTVGVLVEPSQCTAAAARVLAECALGRGPAADAWYCSAP